MAPEDVDTEIETDNTVRDMYTLLNTMHDLQPQLQEKDQRLREQNEMLKKKDQTVREQNQTIQKLLATQGRFDISQLEEASPVDQKLSVSFSPYQMLREKDQVLREEDQAIQNLRARHGTSKCQGCVVQ
jgi:FtsZ-binding cell division protein ZapB